jgi:hypothetical protein
VSKRSGLFSEKTMDPASAPAFLGAISFKHGHFVQE